MGLLTSVLYRPKKLTLSYTLRSSFWSGADKFVAVFDPAVDSFELHRDELPFALNAICYVASFIEDGGKGTSERQKQVRSLPSLSKDG